MIIKDGGHGGLHLVMSTTDDVGVFLEVEGV
jgi:hypothetical protein